MSKAYPSNLTYAQYDTNSQNWAEKSDLTDACYSKHPYQLNLQLLLKTGINGMSAIG